MQRLTHLTYRHHSTQALTEVDWLAALRAVRHVFDVGTLQIQTKCINDSYYFRLVTVPVANYDEVATPPSYKETLQNSRS